MGAYREYKVLLLGKQMCLTQQSIQTMILLATNAGKTKKIIFTVGF